MSNVIKEAKRIYYDQKNPNSSIKCKTTWDIIKKLSNNQHSQTGIQELIIDIKHLKRYSRYLQEIFFIYNW